MKPESTVAKKVDPAMSDHYLEPLFYLLRMDLWLPLFAVFFGVQPLSAQFVYTTIQGGIHIRLYEGQERNVVIPDTIDGLPVTRVEQTSFLFQSLIKRVNHPEYRQSHRRLRFSKLQPKFRAHWHKCRQHREPPFKEIHEPSVS